MSLDPELTRRVAQHHHACADDVILAVITDGLRQWMAAVCLHATGCRARAGAQAAYHPRPHGVDPLARTAASARCR